MGSLKVNAAQPDYVKQPSPKPAATLPVTQHKETRLVCQQRAQHTLPATRHHVCLSRGRWTPHRRKEHARLFCSLFALSIIKHTGRSKQEETSHQTTYHKHLWNCMSNCLTVSRLQFTSSKILSTAPNKKIQTKMIPFIQTTYYTPIPLICIVCSDPDSIICRLQGMPVLPSLALRVCVSSLRTPQPLHKKRLSTSVLFPD